jgi:ABC-2 type transport system permease protein
MRARWLVLVRKELLDAVRNRSALLPTAAVTVIALALPFAVALVVPAATGDRLADDRDLAALGRLSDPSLMLGDEGRVQLFLFQQFLLLFLLTPITGAMALAAHAVVGEKQARTLEPLLATPITTIELLVAKVLGAFLPTLAIALAGLLLYLAGIGWFAEPGVLRALMNARTFALLFLVAPASALVSLQAAIVVSSRVTDPRTAQQFAVLIVLPLAGVFVAQLTGLLWLSPAALCAIGAGLGVVWVALTFGSVALFDRETILTRWR